MNHGDSFILDEGRTLTVWIGEGSSPVEKRKALEVARRIKDEERGGRATIDVISKCTIAATLPYYLIVHP